MVIKDEVAESDFLSEREQGSSQGAQDEQDTQLSSS